MKKILLFITAFGLLFSVKQVLAQSPTPTDNIREKVQEKVQAALNRPKAYMGTVTDISESTLQLKNLKGEIKQVSANEKITVANIISTAKEVKFSDIAIGDFVVAMGYVGPNTVLDTKRVLVTSSPSAPTRKSYLVNIDSYSKNKGAATIVKDNQKINFTTSSTTKFQLLDEEEITQGKVTDVKTGGKAIITGVQTEKDFTIRRVLVLQ